MVARADIARLTAPFAPPTLAAVGGTVAGATVALACLAGPAGLLESVVGHSGVAALVNAAAPPLGLTARAVLATGGGLLVAAVTWAILVLVAGDRRVPTGLPSLRLPTRRPKRLPGGQAVRRADSHPDAPPRPPILAERDLGAPFLSIVAAEQSVPSADDRALPADLDTALAAIDPAAIPDVPREPARPVAPLAVVAASPRPATSPIPSLASSPPLAPGERIDSIELGADVRDRQDTIESLLARLERGARRRPVSTVERAPPPESEAVGAEPGGSLAETLGSLRRLAMRG